MNRQEARALAIQNELQSAYKCIQEAREHITTARAEIVKDHKPVSEIDYLAGMLAVVQSRMARDASEWRQRRESRKDLRGGNHG